MEGVVGGWVEMVSLGAVGSNDNTITTPTTPLVTFQQEGKGLIILSSAQ